MKKIIFLLLSISILALDLKKLECQLYSKNIINLNKISTHYKVNKNKNKMIVEVTLTGESFKKQNLKYGEIIFYIIDLIKVADQTIDTITISIVFISLQNKKNLLYFETHYINQ